MKKPVVKRFTFTKEEWGDRPTIKVGFYIQYAKNNNIDIVELYVEDVLALRINVTGE